MSVIKPSIWLSSSLPFRRLEHKIIFVLIMLSMIPVSMLLLQLQEGKIPEYLVPSTITLLWASILALFVAILLVTILIHPVQILVRAVETYHLKGEDPELPSYYSDEMGRLLGNVQVLIRSVLRQERLLKAASMEEYLGAVYNRGWCERRLSEEIDRSRFTREPLAIGVMLLSNLEYLKQSEGPSTAQYCQEHLLNSIRGNAPVEHWVARWAEGKILFVAWASPQESEIICNRIHSGIQSATLRTPMGKALNLDLRQCLLHFNGQDDVMRVLEKLDDAVSQLQDEGKNTRLLRVA